MKSANFIVLPLLLVTVLVLFSCKKNSEPVSELQGCCEIDGTTRNWKNFSFYIPSIFTPNNDGINDVFAIFSNDEDHEIVLKELSIYNRAQTLIFQQTLNTPLGFSKILWVGIGQSGLEPQGRYSYSIALEHLASQEQINFEGMVCIVSDSCLTQVQLESFTINNCRFPTQNDRGLFNEALPSLENFPICD